MNNDQVAGGPHPRRLFVYTAGFLRQQRLRRILQLSGHQLRLGLPGPQDLVGVWGQSPYAHRGEAMAKRSGAGLVRIEDAFLRSLFPGRSGEPPLGLLIDHSGVHFDGRAPSDLETLLQTDPLDDSALLARARGAMARMAEHHLSKYSATDPDAPLPDPGYVLVVDQTRGDASVSASGADRNRFLEMLFIAREEHPAARIVIRSHPETAQGLRPGHLQATDCGPHTTFYDGPASPRALLENAVAVYTVSSQMGFEAILTGHRPRVFGQPFYAGWDLSDDEMPIYRRQRRLTSAQLFAGAMMLYPKWYDPCFDRLCEIEDLLGNLEAQTRAWREDRHGWIASGMRLWKRSHLQKFYGSYKALQFKDKPDIPTPAPPENGPKRMVWANKASAPQITRIEDGFLRSRGLGAELTPPLSLVSDPLGIYYDPTRPSALETMIARRAQHMSFAQIRRIERIIHLITTKKLSKYNLSGDLPDLPTGKYKILVPGQVEDDASILTGSPDIQSNETLLARTRDANPDALIIWKPHPDVAAGLRRGHVQHPEKYADIPLTGTAIAPLLDQVDAVWTLTSLTGFEALLRRKQVTVFGAPFYAGWSLTRDLGPVPVRRMQGPRPSIEALAYATLIDYPRYRDPISGQPCSVETIIERLHKNDIPPPGAFNRILSKIQGRFASHASLWRG